MFVSRGVGLLVRTLIGACGKCSFTRGPRCGFVNFVDRSGLADIAGAEARDAAADRKADELEALFGYGA